MAGESRAALLVAAGAASGAFSWLVVAAFGFSGLLNLHPGLMAGLWLLGGANLLYLSQKSVRAAVRRPVGLSVAEPARRITSSAFARGLMISLTNPNAALMYAAVAAVLVGAGATARDLAGFVPLATATGFLVYAGYAGLFSLGAMRRRAMRWGRAFELVTGCLFAMVAVRCLLNAVGG